jgi:hypothetical protein
MHADVDFRAEREAGAQLDYSRILIYKTPA